VSAQLLDQCVADGSFAGLYNIIFLIPAFPLLHYSGIETFEFPPTGAAWTIIGINMLITLSSDYLYVLAMLKTTPLRESAKHPLLNSR
jgi:solute carrier family 35 protein F5